MDQPTCPCKWCGVQTPYLGTKECDRCHNITSNLQGIPDEALRKIIDAHRESRRHPAETRAHQLLGKASFASKADWYALKECILELGIAARERGSDVGL